jgi:hypothetical protein
MFLQHAFERLDRLTNSVGGEDHVAARGNSHVFPSSFARACGDFSSGATASIWWRCHIASRTSPDGFSLLSARQYSGRITRATCSPLRNSLKLSETDFPKPKSDVI